jgi:polyhydroxybutyrate depolymerase
VLSVQRLVGRAALFLLPAAFLAACSGDSGAPTQPRLGDLPSFDGVRDFADTLTVDGVLRRYRVHLPSNYEHERLKSIPLLIVYHGAGEDGEQMQLATGLDTLADIHDFAVAYPNAVAGHWAGTPDGNPAQRQGVEDVGFTRALIRNLAEDYAIIPEAAFATGFSRGGFFIQFMACQVDTPVRAIAAVGATMHQDVAALCTSPSNLAPEPISALLMHGDQDNSVPASGGEDILSVAQTASVLVQLNECRGDATVTFPPMKPSPQSIRIRRSLFDRCADGTRVQIDVVEGGTHKWFGALDPGSPFSASEVVVDFLRTAGGM